MAAAQLVVGLTLLATLGLCAQGCRDPLSLPDVTDARDASDASDAVSLDRDGSEARDADSALDAGPALDGAIDATDEGDSAGPNNNDDAAPPATVRVAAANVTSGTLQSYDPGHGQRILQGLRLDVVLLQEFNVRANTPEDIRAWVDATFGVDFHYVRGGEAGIPNGVISRWPLRGSGTWADPRVSNRGFTWARIDLPGPRDLFAVSLHLLTSNATERDTEGRSLAMELRTAVTPADDLVVGGDLNTNSRTESVLGTLSEFVVVTEPWPADSRMNTNTNTTRTRPYDWLMASPRLHARQVAFTVGGSSFANGFVADTQVHSPIEELAPAMASDSAATGMQHMAVARAFAP
jgi:endonuclease/exonuclease/phosphatase family metal-dependent hydrolase